MLISEIFFSIQGEGELAGVPSVFVRTAGCNLRCRWCDTPYASWNPEGKEAEVSEIVLRVAHYPANHVVLTGGEPMVAKDIQELAFALRAAGKHITIETAATVPPDGIACDLASLSPKLSHSAPDAEQAGAWRDRHEATRWQPAVLAAWLRDYRFQLKFVVTGEKDLEEIDRWIAAAGVPVPPHKVLLMPEGTDRDEIIAKAPALVGLCKSRGFRYCPRLHIELFGNVRGT
jgi:7-carboxy-7-deazaguanine synthase